MRPAADVTSVIAVSTCGSVGTDGSLCRPRFWGTPPPPSSPSSIASTCSGFPPSSVAALRLGISARSIPIRALAESLNLPNCTAPSSAADTMASSTASADSKPFAVLFVCLGNICRSPAAEAAFRDLVGKKGLDAHFKIDSAGTIGYHEGNRADSRMIAASKRRGIEVTSISRPIRPSDFRDFDLILAMDLQNKDDILAAYERWKVKVQLPEDAEKKVKLMCSYCKRHKETEVPDPYYGGPKGFEKVLDLLEDACSSLLNCIVSEDSHISSS